MRWLDAHLVRLPAWARVLLATLCASAIASVAISTRGRGHARTVPMDLPAGGPDAPAPQSSLPPLASNSVGCDQRRPWVVADGALYIQTPRRVIAMAPDGRTAVLPPHVRRLWMEVGVYTRTDFWATLQKYPNEMRDLAIWGLEPNARLVEGHPAHEAVTLFNAAASDTEGSARFNLWSPTGASLQALGPAHARYLSVEQRSAPPPFFEVPVIRLETLLHLVPPGVRVEYLKVDAQGTDLRVLQGAGALLARVEMVTAECQDLPDRKDVRLFYADACLVKELRAYMEAQGFVHQNCVMQNYDISEFNCHFGRSKEALERATSLFAHEAW